MREPIPLVAMVDRGLAPAEAAGHAASAVGFAGLPSALSAVLGGALQWKLRQGFSAVVGGR